MNHTTNLEIVYRYAEKDTYNSRLFILPLSGQEPTIWTLEERISYAVGNNIEVRTGSLSVEEARIELNTVKNSRPPDLNAGVSQNFGFGQASVRRYDETNDIWFDTYEDTRTASNNFSASSSIVLFAGGQITNQATVTELNESQARLLRSNSEQLQAKYEFIFRTKMLDFYKKIPIKSGT